MRFETRCTQVSFFLALLFTSVLHAQSCQNVAGYWHVLFKDLSRIPADMQSLSISQQGCHFFSDTSGHHLEGDINSNGGMYGVLSSNSPDGCAMAVRLDNYRGQLMLNVYADAHGNPCQDLPKTPADNLVVFSTIPGFQGTLNNYDVGMNPIQECQHPPNGHQACSQWFHFKFQADTNGRVHAPIRITNDTLNPYCGRVTFIVKDHPGGTVLGQFVSPRVCIDAKGADTNWHERTGYADWDFQADPAVGQRGGDLYGFGMNE